MNVTVKITERAAKVLEACGYKGKNALRKAYADILEGMPAPSFKVDAFDEIYIMGNQLSALRDNVNKELTIMTIKEAHELDCFAVNNNLM